MENETKTKKGIKSVLGVIYKIVVAVLVLFVLFETVMGLLDMQRLNEDKEPIWYIDSKIEENEGKKETTYNLGLYVIIKEETYTEKKVSLKPFFLK